MINYDEYAIEELSGKQDAPHLGQEIGGLVAETFKNDETIPFHTEEVNKLCRTNVDIFFIPDDLKALDQWVVWKYEQKGKKWTKVPYDAKLHGIRASSTKPSSWSSFNTAYNAYEERADIDGIGFVLTPEDPYVGIDLDHCVDDASNIDLWANSICNTFQSYTEITPSGHGLRIFIKGKLPAKGRKEGDIEVYDRSRYFTITGNFIYGSSINIVDAQDRLNSFLKEYFPVKVPQVDSFPSQSLRSDEEIIALASNASNGEKFSRLFSGDHSMKNSQSNADASLCTILAFWCCKDTEQIDRIFRQSGLMRPKWDEPRGKETYGFLTIQKAIAHCSDTYSSARDNITECRETKDAKKHLTMQDAVLSADDIMELQLPERTYYLRPWLRDSSIILIDAPRGLGKSFFVLSTLLAAASGTDFGPWQSHLSVPCLYLDGEMHETDNQERLRMLQAHKGIPFYIYNDCYANSLCLPKSNIANLKWREDFKNLLIEKGIKVVAFDNIASLSPGLDENSKQEWDPINQWLLQLRFAGISSILVHHTGKSGKQRGTSGREDNVDVSIDLVRPADYSTDEGCRFIAHFSKHRLPQPDLSLITDTEFKLVIKNGSYEWSFGNVEAEARNECLRLLSQEYQQTTIAEMLKKSKGTISKWKKAFIHAGYLKNTGELTPQGRMYLLECGYED